MAFWIVLLLSLVAIGGGVLYLLRDQSLDRERVEAELHDPRTATLEYSVPTGQDPVAILAALERAGFTAGVDPHHAHQVVLVKCPEGREHARGTVRELIGSSLQAAPHRVEVHFRDEE
jgi:hypothetical protein